MYGDKVVWQDLNPATFTYDIMLFNITTGVLYNLTPDTASTDQTFPSIYGNRVAWLDMRGTTQTGTLPLPGIGVTGKPSRDLIFEKGLAPSFSLSSDKKNAVGLSPVIVRMAECFVHF